MRSQLLAKSWLMLLFIQLFLPFSVQAETVTDLTNREEDVVRQSEMLSTQVQTALDEVNEKYRQVAQIKDQVAEQEETLSQTQTEIAETKDVLHKRKSVVADRLKSMQLNGYGKQDWTVLLESDNFQQFVQRAYAISKLQHLEKEKITNLYEETEKLEALQIKETATKDQLTKSQESLSAEATSLSSQITALQDELANNESALQQISARKAFIQEQLQAKEKRLTPKKEKEKKQSEKREDKKKDTQQTPPPVVKEKEKPDESTSERPVERPQEEKPKPEPPQQGGRVLTMESTAYSYNQPGLGFITAMGIDLRKNPHVIAVDPSVIPLGSVVEVEGYGIALAADTGGAIRGNIIDVHFADESRCKTWGRRHVKVKIFD